MVQGMARLTVRFLFFFSCVEYTREKSLKNKKCVVCV